jgi:hypothetical protein
LLRSTGVSRNGPGRRPAVHWLVVVRPEREEIVARFRRTFGRMPLVEILYDRRRGERRRGSRTGAPDRRRGDRRQSHPHSGIDLLESPSGYRVVERGDGYQVLEAQARVRVECPECEAALEFEMPRFGELPARLDLEVVHGAGGGSRLQHVVEARAYRPSGRPFLACRMVARRRWPDPVPLASLS